MKMGLSGALALKLLRISRNGLYRLGTVIRGQDVEVIAPLIIGTASQNQEKQHNGQENSQGFHNLLI